MAWACRRCQRVYSALPSDERCPHDEGELVRVTDRSLHDEHTGRVCDEKYRIEKLLGAGGMGCVHEATNLRLDQKVAVKFFSPRFAMTSGSDSAEAAERFRREATVMARARHPNVVHVLDFSIETDGTMYIVMELLEGQPFDARLAAGGCSLEKGLAIISTVLKALEYVHSQDVVHRDLKPSNIYCAEVAGRDTVKVLDFGIARIAGSPTITHGPLGTWRYAAPEQLAGEEVGPTADVYSAGIILAEMVSGQPVSGSSVASGVPAPVLEVISKATDQNPAARYPDAREMGLALLRATGALSEEERTRLLPKFSAEKGRSSPPQPTPPTPVLGQVPAQPEAQSQSQSHRRLALAGIVLGLLLGVIGFLAAMLFGGFGSDVEPAGPDSGGLTIETPDATAVGTGAAHVAGDSGTVASDAAKAQATVRVTFLASPKQATVFQLDGVGQEAELCSTNCIHSFAASSEPVKVVFRAEGFQPLEQEFQPDEDRIVEAKLAKALHRPSNGPAKGKHPTRPIKAPDHVVGKAGSGFISVRAIPQSDVFLDGARLGRSPIAKRAVPTGSHRLRLVPVKGALGQGVSRPPRTITVNIVAGQTRAVVEYW